jgi:hypothetical protein
MSTEDVNRTAARAVLLSQFDRIANAILELQDAFRAAGMDPTAIDLSCREDGERMKRIGHTYLQEAGGVSAAININEANPSGQPNMQVEICGTVVRWPAQVRALPRGRFRIE